MCSFPEVRPFAILWEPGTLNLISSSTGYCHCGIKSGLLANRTTVVLLVVRPTGVNNVMRFSFVYHLFIVGNQECLGWSELRD